MDATTARLVVPFEGTTETYTVFDPETRLLQRLESLRFKGERDAAKTVWINEVREWGQLDDKTVALATAVRWGDEDTAWAVPRTEELLFNADLSDYIRTEGP